MMWGIHFLKDEPSSLQEMGINYEKLEYYSIEMEIMNMQAENETNSISAQVEISTLDKFLVVRFQKEEDQNC